MLFYLSLAAKAGYEVESYEDTAVGTLERNGEGRMAMTRVILAPHVVYAQGSEPGRPKEEKMHHRAHDVCFIANSVRTEIQTVIR